MACILEGRHRAAQHDQEERLSIAWHSEALARQERLPTLAKFLSRRPAPSAPRQQSPDEMLAVFQAIAASGAPMTIQKVR